MEYVRRIVDEQLDRSIEEIDALIPILTSSDLDIVRKELQKRL